MLNIISLGAGKQSSFMLLEALNGRFGIQPDMAIISDTGCEPKYVYDYLDWLIDYVKPFPIVVVSAGDLIEDTLSYLNGESKRVAMLPLRLQSGGLLTRQCTYDYKIAPIRRHLQKIRNGERIKLWIGISLDEMERQKESNVKYIEHYYPLIEHRIRIDEIVNYFDKSGLKIPGKSACLICPFHSDAYWKRFKKAFPIEFEDACKFDDKIRDYPKLREQTYLSKHRKPLRDIDFSYQDSLFPELIEECEGLCGL